ncbi:MAG: FtsH protease activity modulator HflK, partial [Alphaproteobacteria bacterium]
MAWNQQGGGGGGGGPWGGGGGGGAQPPDLEEMLRRGQERFRSAMPGGLGGARGIFLVVLAIVVVWLLSGIYRVQPGEQGVELLLGKYVKSTSAGLHVWFPAPIGEVQTPNVERTNTISVGFRVAGAGGHSAVTRDVPEESLMLTGDQNIIDIDYQVQWRIKSAKDFLFNIRDPEATVKLASESAIREVIGQTPLEDALATKRQEVDAKTKELLQKILDSYGAGVYVSEVKMQKVDPPQPVIDAFNDVQRAKQDRERQQNEAEAYRNDILPKAKGEAQRIIQEATGYREQQIKEAEGEAKRFLSVYEAYKTGKDVT